LNCRNFFKHLWALQDKRGLNPGAVGSHSTHAYIFPSLPWIDAVLDGERGQNLDTSDKDWIDEYPIAQMRAFSNPHNWGVGICWMGIFYSKTRARLRPPRRRKANTSSCTIRGLTRTWRRPIT
jgi:hypothetical protein